MAIMLLAYVLAFRMEFGAQAADSGDSAILLAYPIRVPLLGLYCFALGIHLARAKNRFRAAPVSSVAMVAATAAVLGVAWLVHWQEAKHPLGLYVGMSAIYLVYTPFFYLLLAWLLRPDVARVLSRPVLILLGNASYALYLLHWLPLTVLIQGPAPFSHSLAWAYITAVALPFIAIAIYLTFEDPARRAIRRWAGGRSSHAAVVEKPASRIN
jgi:peptidoglycan/LPS O-acetylase OafA/YrhL